MTIVVGVLCCVSLLAQVSATRNTRAYAVNSAAVSNAPGFYLLQFRVPISMAVVERIASVVGYEPRDYVPENALVLWLDSQERGEAVLRTVPHVETVYRLTGDLKRMDVRSEIDSLRVKARQFKAVRANASAPLSVDDARTIDLYRHDAASGALVVDIRVHARPELATADIAEMAQASCRTKIVASDDGAAHPLERLLINVHCDDAARIAETLSQDPRVAWIELRPPFESLNRWAVDTLHVATADSANKESIQRLPFKGANQLLSVSDTGIEFDLCFFRDNMPPPLADEQTVPPDNGHRTIRAYWDGQGGDFRDIGGGHGTHVCGTALGAPLSGDAREFAGAAPEARLVMIDLLAADSGFLAVPLDIGSTLLQWSSDVGARVHSASWGAALGGRYSSDEQSVDRFAYFNRHFLPIFAAGNGGPSAPSIVSPAMAKNALSIGATMNGVEAVRLAQTPSREADAYSPDWLASFSSRGSSALPVRKPDLVAPGGAYMWSASNDGPSTGACSPLSQIISGLQGTSMATPLVAGGAILVREYFVDNHHPDSVGTGIDTRAPTASLVRATLVAGAVPLRGVFPQSAFATDQERIDASGHGRVALDRSLESSQTQLAVLSNEDAEHALARTRYHRWCVEVRGIGNYDSIAVVLAYADYPSSPIAAASIINDLRLTVTDGDGGGEFIVNDQPGIAEKRSTIERALVDGTRRFTVEVRADAIGFGDTQSYSLVVALRRPDTKLTLRVIDAGETACATCASESNAFIPDSECSECGNGIVEAPAEECDSSVCCDPSTCKLLSDQSQCVVLAGECPLRGQCRADVDAAEPCAIDPSNVYEAGPDGECVVRDGSKDDAPCVARTSSEWALRIADGVAALGDRQLCCSPLRSAFEHIEFEHLFGELAREYAAAQLNALEPGAATTPRILLAIEEAHMLLESRCGVGFTELSERQVATALVHDLRESNEACGAVTDPVANNNECNEDSLSQLLCHSGGTYDRETASCLCHSNRQPSEPDCAHLHCSGNGVSLHDYKTNSDRCVCFDGWRGSTCAQCSESDDTTFAYHCVGLPARLANNAVQAHYMALVDRSSVDSRLSGRFYGRVLKISDAVPGTQGLDCACRAEDERPNWRSASSHFDVVEDHFERQRQVDRLGAQAQSFFAALSKSASSASRRVAHSAVAFAALTALFIN